MAKDHGPQVKDDETYEALRDDGASKERPLASPIPGRKVTTPGKKAERPRTTTTVRSTSSGTAPPTWTSKAAPT